jgi:phosphohistidine phosphatase SixA
MISLIALRHAQRVRPPATDAADAELPLDATGVQQVDRLVADFGKKGIRPGTCFTSGNEHAYETAERLLKGLSIPPEGNIHRLEALTPSYQGPASMKPVEWIGADILRSVIQELTVRGAALDAGQPAVLILHQPRLRQMLTGLIREPKKENLEFGYSEGVMLEAPSLQDFLSGDGKIAFYLRSRERG